MPRWGHRPVHGGRARKALSKDGDGCRGGFQRAFAVHLCNRRGGRRLVPADLHHRYNGRLSLRAAIAKTCGVCACRQPCSTSESPPQKADMPLRGLMGLLATGAAIGCPALKSGTWWRGTRRMIASRPKSTFQLRQCPPRACCLRPSTTARVCSPCSSAWRGCLLSSPLASRVDAWPVAARGDPIATGGRALYFWDAADLLL